MTCLTRRPVAIEQRDESFKKCTHFLLIQHARGDEQRARGDRYESGVGFDDPLDLVGRGNGGGFVRRWLGLIRPPHNL